MKKIKVYLDNCCYNRPNQGLDYTKWRENLWEDLTLRELLERAVSAEEKYGVPKNVEVI